MRFMILLFASSKLLNKKFNCSIIQFYSDNGGEFLAFHPFLAHHDISHLTIPPHTPEHNGLFERRHCHIVETGLTILHHASLYISYWPHAFATTTYLINHIPKTSF